MAWMLAGLIGHWRCHRRGGIISALFVWLGFVHHHHGREPAFQGVKPSVTAIDAGHWLAVLLVMGAIIGAFGV